MNDQEMTFHERMDELVGYIDDHIVDYRGSSDPLFVDGAGQVRHLVREFQLSYSDEVSCECDVNPNPLPLHLVGGDWACPDCGGVLLAGDDDPTE